MVSALLESLDKINEYTEKNIGCAFRVSNILGSGFLEKVYENALVLELKKAGLKIDRQIPLKVYYEEVVVGEFIADLLIEKTVLVELKSISALDENHFSQCMNYLKATGLKLCLLINFVTRKVQIKRVIN